MVHRLKLCPSVYLQVLFGCKAARTTRKALGNAVLGILFKVDDPPYYSDAVISELSHGKKNLGGWETDAAWSCDANGASVRFVTEVIPLLDPSKQGLLVAAVKAVIASDEGIEDSAIVDLVDGLSKEDIVRLWQVNVSRFATGVFLYAVRYTSNRGTDGEASAVTPGFFSSLASEAASLVLSERCELAGTKCVTLWHRGPNRIQLQAGDLFAEGTEDTRGLRRIVVVPVDTSYSTGLSRNLETDDTSLVSPATVHGKWLRLQYAKGVDAGMISERVARVLELRGQSENGNARLGAVAPIDDGNQVWYLLAISQFDKGGNAHSTKDEIQKAVACLANFYGKEGQGYPLYMPLVGTGRSRAGLGYQDSLEVILSALVQNAGSIQGSVTIVVESGAMKELDVEEARRKCGLQD